MEVCIKFSIQKRKQFVNGFARSFEKWVSMFHNSSYHVIFDNNQQINIPPKSFDVFPIQNWFSCKFMDSNLVWMMVYYHDLTQATSFFAPPFSWHSIKIKLFLFFSELHKSKSCRIICFELMQKKNNNNKNYQHFGHLLVATCLYLEVPTLK